MLDADDQLWGHDNQDNDSRNNQGPDVNLNRFDLSDPGTFYQTLPVSDADRNGYCLVWSSRVRFTTTHRAPSLPAFIEVFVGSIPADTQLLPIGAVLLRYRKQHLRQACTVALQRAGRLRPSRRSQRRHPVHSDLSTICTGAYLHPQA